ncbi:MAG: outer membrane beta-barrel protein [Melioribacteraceae bacterium]|nr:outer membrane beta-barrel protein [Melioribacteraceae bacterium]MCF8356202.1 outer membrane beta-barrel protein [Melioribacteraceae bacterium]MCF8396496.1 outer membrane beta-barrel protein [Melioribacteraceae bacterium]MCF8420051.1 outer membrane beta-barrel protein [Melioribacteraceae bacterium]
MRKTILIILVIFISKNITGQSDWSAEGKLNLILPGGMFGELYSTGFGGTANLYYRLSSSFDLFLSTGFLTTTTDNGYFERKIDEIYGYKITIDNTAYFSIIPLQLGINFYAASGKYKPYLTFQYGLYYVIEDNMSLDITTGQTVDISKERTEAVSGYGIGAGLLIDMNKNMSINISALYNGNSYELKESYKVQTSLNSYYSESRSESIKFIRIAAGFKYYL